MKLQAFRAYPVRQLRTIQPAWAGSLMVSLFKAADRKGRISNFLADPQTAYEWLIPYASLTAGGSRALPSVSVVMATRNNAGTIEKAVSSILSQRGCNLELIIVDDASSDASPSIMRKLADRESRITLVRNDVQKGTGASRNIGLSLATGDYATFQDGDDVSLPGRLAMQAEALIATGAKVCLCNYARINHHGERLVVNNQRVMKCIISMMFPREEILSKVGFFIESDLSEDSDYYQRMKIAFGAASETSVPRTLYEALLRDDSSFFSSVQLSRVSDLEISYSKLPKALSIAEELRVRHDRMRTGELGVFVGYTPPQSLA